MKKIMNLLMALSMATMMLAETEYLPISVYIQPVQEPFPHNAEVHMANKLTQLLAKQGIASMSDNSQFLLTVFAVPQNKEVLTGAPTQYVEIMEMTFYIADALNEVVYATTSQTVRGVGTTDTKAYMDAIKKINIGSKEMADFVKTGKEKIIAYYDHEGERILDQAKTLMAMKQYDAAIYTAMAIPAQSKHFQQAQQLMISSYQGYVDQTCQENLAQAKMAWAAEQNSTGAAEAGQYLALIYPDAKCYGDAEELYREIKAKVLDDWKFEMKKYNDKYSLESQRIGAAKEVGVAYGNHQQPTSTNIGFLR